jgi:transposase
MQAITTIGLDIAKSVFQIHAVDARGNVVLRRQIKRRYVLGMGGRTARNAEPVDPAIRTTQLPPSIVECGLSIGT